MSNYRFLISGINDKQDIKDDEHWAEFIKRFNKLKGSDEPNKPLQSNSLNRNESNQHLSYKVIPRLYRYTSTLPHF